MLLSHLLAFAIMRAYKSRYSNQCMRASQGFRVCTQLFIIGRIPVSSVMQLLENYPAIVNAGADSCTLDLCLLVDSIGL